MSSRRMRPASASPVEGTLQRPERISSFSGVVKRMVVCASCCVSSTCAGEAETTQPDGVRVAGDFLA